MAESSQRKGPIAWMAQNSVAANLLMFLILVGGILGITRIKQEVFPEFEMDMVRVTVPYPGAAPAEVEQGIVLAVEEAVRGVDGVKRVTSESKEGAGTVAVELLIGEDGNEVLQDIKSEVDRIQTFPEDSEKPQVVLVSQRRKVVSLILSGDHELSTLHALAEKARADLLAGGGVTVVEVEGVPPLEVSVELSRQTLQSYGLTLDEVAQQIRAASLELPGGAIETDGGELLVRVADRKKRGHELGEIILRSTAQGSSVRLADIATIKDGFADTKQESTFNGKPAVRVTAYRVGDEAPSEVAAVVRDYKDELSAELPDNVELTIWDDDSVLLEGRIDLLVRNARLGLILVVGILALFLNARLAFWVALGIPISFLGALILMPVGDVSINMISLFALIITLGMVVDDAIVVGENAFQKMQEGMDQMDAAIEGAKEMAMPVTFAVLTSIVAFSPMFFVPGTMGKIFSILPSVVLFVLIFSWLESFVILPAHLGHAGGAKKEPGALRRALDTPRRVVAGALERFIDQRFEPVLRAVIGQRYIAGAAAGALLFVSLGLVGSGIIPFSPMPKLEGDVITVGARLPYGAPVERTKQVRRQIEAAAYEAVAEFGGPEGLVSGMFTRLGEGPVPGGPVGGAAEIGSHLVTIELELTPGETRDISSAEIAEVWQNKLPPMAGLEALNFTTNLGPSSGRPVDIQLSHRDTDLLAQISAEVTDSLRSYSQLSQVENGYAAGKPQLDYQLKDAARTLGLTGSDVARQIRSAFYGAEALREQRDRNEVKVMVRLPEEQRQSEHDLEELEIRTPRGGNVPLDYVASFERGRAPTSIRREDGKRIVNVSAELAPGVASATPVLESVRDELLPQLQEQYPGLGADLVGEQREFGEAVVSLLQNYAVAMFAIYALLAVPFRSYIQPAIVMMVIPMGIVGAVWGHLLMGFEISLISLFGIVALSGVVVNDSLVLIDATNRYRREGMSAMEAIVRGAQRRFRPILLTSLTTFFGLAPMIFETSMQARFLIPMAISLGYGILFVTVIVLLLVPALYIIVEDVAGLVRRLLGRATPVTATEAPAK